MLVVVTSMSEGNVPPPNLVRGTLSSASLEPSYVLRALGLNDEMAHSSLRFGIGRFTTEEEVDYAIEKIKLAVTKLRELSPLWDMFKDGIDLDTVEWAAH